MSTGNISIHAQNIMPVIKRWLYSDKDIFIRELVSNGCDAITKYKMLHIGENDDYSVRVTVNKDEGVIVFEDNGIGMTWEEVEKYINQVAFSSAEEFLKNYGGDQDAADKGGIIGHFGLGFYSAFMAADRVTIDTLSYQEGAKAVRWESTDGMTYEMNDSDRTQRGTRITLHIMESEKEFLEGYRVREVLTRYCGFMASPIYLTDISAEAEKARRKEEKRREKEEKRAAREKAKEERRKKKEAGEEVPEETDDQADEPDFDEPSDDVNAPVNDTCPLWLKAPKDCTDEEYKSFYRKLFHVYEDPLFWIHLNVEYPFNLKGILYFPRIKNDFGGQEGEIKLFSGQVFVADNIKEIIPEFLMLLRGVIDCPDLPLNVSRSFLQNDGYVKKLSTHITKKVGDKLNALFNTERANYEKYWDDIHPFVKYGCIRDGRFFENVKGSLLFKTTAGDFLTLGEYAARNEGKADKKVYYTTEKDRQAASVALYTQRGIDVVVMDTLIDMNFISFMEYSGGDENKPAFVRVDADVSGLTEQTDEGKDIAVEPLTALFRSALGKDDLEVKLEALSDAQLPAMLVEDEQTRRFKEMSKAYGEKFPMPDKYTLVLNRRSDTVRALAARDAQDEVAPLIAKQLYDLARMASRPLEPAELAEFLTRSNKLVGMLA